MRAGDEPPALEDDATPATSHLAVSHDSIARRYRALGALYGLPMEITDGNTD